MHYCCLVGGSREGCLKLKSMKLQLTIAQVNYSRISHQKKQKKEKEKMITACKCSSGDDHIPCLAIDVKMYKFEVVKVAYM